MIDHINGYSLALFSLAKEEKKIKQYKDEANLIIESLMDTKDFESFLDAKSIELEIKNKVIEKSFGGKIDKHILNFLLILVERHKMRVAIPALKKLVKFINENLNINEGVVFSSEKLSPKELKDIQIKTEKVLGIKIYLENKIDFEIISGFRIQVGDEVIEDTVASRLEDIRNQLLGKEN